MDNKLLLAVKLIARDMELMRRGSNFSSDGQSLFMGMGMALRHLYYAEHGRICEKPNELLKWAHGLSMPQIPDSNGRKIV